MLNIHKKLTPLYPLLCLILCAVLLTGCQQSIQDTTALPTTTVSPEPTLEEQLYDLFSKPGSWYNLALSNTYASAKDIDLSLLFAHGFEDESKELTDEECTLLKAKGITESKTMIRLPKEKINTVLEQYFDLSLPETNGIGVENFVYLEETGCYYAHSTDTEHVTELRILSVEPTSYGYCIAYETDSSNGNPYLLVASYNTETNKALIRSNTHPDYTLGKFPTIPAVNKLTDKPTEPAVDNLVFCNYETSVSWDLHRGDDAHYFNMRLPAVIPFCEGAISINEDIQKTFSVTLINARNQYYHVSSGYSNQQYDIDYQAWLNGHVLSILITKTLKDYRHEYYVYSLDISTGQRLSTADLTKAYLNEGYAEFLYHASYNAKSYYKDLNGKAMKAPTFNSHNISEYFMHDIDLYIADGVPMLVCEISHASFFINVPYKELDCYGWSKSEQDVYDGLWGKYLNTMQSVHYETLLRKIFFEEPQTFIRMLSQQEDELQETNIERLVPWDQGSDYEPYKAFCQELVKTSTDAIVKQIAQKMLDAVFAAARPESSEPAQTVAPTTEPTNKYNVVGALPPVPFVEVSGKLPEEPNLADIVFTHYQHTVSWDSRDTGERQTYSAALPAITPFSEDSKAINQEIRNDYDGLEFVFVRDYYEKGFVNTFKDTSYTAYLNEDILSLILYYGDQVNKIYTLDISTGKRMTNADLGRKLFDQSYAEFLYHITGTRYEVAYDWAVKNGYTDLYAPTVTSKLESIENDTLDISYYKPYRNENGIRVMSWSNEWDGDAQILTINPDAQCSMTVNSVDGAYQWLFSIDPGTSDYMYSCLLKDVFVVESDIFIRQLSNAPQSERERLADQLMRSVPSEEITDIQAVCEAALSSATDDRTKETAQALLDALQAQIDRIYP